MYQKLAYSKHKKTATAKTVAVSRIKDCQHQFGLLQPVVNFHFRLNLAVAILLLQDTSEFFRFTAEPLDVIIGEFAPVLFRLNFELRSLAF